MFHERNSPPALHLAFVYIGAGARGAALAHADGLSDVHVEDEDLGGLVRTYVCMSPPSVAAMLGVQTFIHVEAYEGENADVRIRQDHVDAVCVFGARASEVVAVLRERALAVKRADLSVTVVDEALARQPSALLERLLGTSVQQYRAGALHNYVPADGDPFLSRPPGHIAQRDPNDAELAEARRRAQVTLDRFIATLKRPGKSHGHSIHAALREGEIVEYVWIRDVRWDGTRFVGRLDEAPVDLRNVTAGDVVAVARGDVEDWSYLDGAMLRGGFTVRVFAARGMLADDLLPMLAGPPLE